jgi:hypothetical protein
MGCPRPQLFTLEARVFKGFGRWGHFRGIGGEGRTGTKGREIALGEYDSLYGLDLTSPQLPSTAK